MSQLDSIRDALPSPGKPLWPAAAIILLVVFTPMLLAWAANLLGQ